MIIDFPDRLGHKIHFQLRGFYSVPTQFQVTCLGPKKPWYDISQPAIPLFSTSRDEARMAQRPKVGKHYHHVHFRGAVVEWSPGGTRLFLSLGISRTVWLRVMDIAIQHEMVSILPSVLASYCLLFLFWKKWSVKVWVKSKNSTIFVKSCFAT